MSFFARNNFRKFVGLGKSRRTYYDVLAKIAFTVPMITKISFISKHANPELRVKVTVKKRNKKKYQSKKCTELIF